VADPGVGHPEDPLIVVDPVAEPSSAHDLELPLFEDAASNTNRAQRSSERVLAIVTVTWIPGDRHPGSIGGF
jgi:hypothetical protein